MTARATTPADSLLRRLAVGLYRHPRIALALLLALPLGWLLVAYLGSLAILFTNAFFRTDPFTSRVIPEFGLGNFGRLLSEDVYRTITLRTLGIAAAVTATTGAGVANV